MKILQRSGSAIVGLLVVVAVFGAGWWSARTALEPPRDPLRSSSPVLVTATRGEVGQTLELGAIGEWLAVGTVRPPVSGTVTSISSLDEPLDAGDVTLGVDLMPVVLAEGSVPAFRELSPGTKGPDVAQLQVFLESQGFEVSDDAGTYGPGTTSAVEDWQESIEEAPTGVVPAGMVTFVPDLPASLRMLNDVGDQVMEGDPVAEILAESPTFRAVVTEEQLMMVPEGATVTLTRGEQEFSGVAGPSEQAEEGLYLTIIGADSGPVCGEQCAVVPTEAASRWVARAEVVPTESGVVLPVGAVRTAGDGSRFVVTEAGDMVQIITGASATGQVVVTGLDPGTAVRLPEGDETDPESGP